MGGTNVRQITDIITLGTAGVITDFGFTADLPNTVPRYNYLGKLLNEQFNNLYLINFTNGLLLISIETDRDNNINLTIPTGQGKIPIGAPGDFSIANGKPFSRLRLLPEKSGDVFIYLWRSNPNGS